MVAVVSFDAEELIFQFFGWVGNVFAAVGTHRHKYQPFSVAHFRDKNLINKKIQKNNLAIIHRNLGYAIKL